MSAPHSLWRCKACGAKWFAGSGLPDGPRRCYAELPNGSQCGNAGFEPVPICETCNERESIGVAAMPGVPMSFAYCLACLKANAHPYWAVVANTACVGSLDACGEWWRDLVAATLKHLGKSREEFDRDVAAQLADMDAANREPE